MNEIDRQKLTRAVALLGAVEGVAFKILADGFEAGELVTKKRQKLTTSNERSANIMRLRALFDLRKLEYATNIRALAEPKQKWLCQVPPACDFDRAANAIRVCMGKHGSKIGAAFEAFADEESRLIEVVRVS